MLHAQWGKKTRSNLYVCSVELGKNQKIIVHILSLGGGIYSI